MTDATPAEKSYNGFPGAFPYAIQASDSWLFKGYVIVAVLLSAFISLFFLGGLLNALASTVGARGGTFTFSRTFVLFVGLLVVAPLLAPVLLVARRHRRTASSVAYDRAMALSALVFVVALFVGLVASTPAELQDTDGTGSVLYTLPSELGLVFPVAAVALMYLVHRRLK